MTNASARFGGINAGSAWRVWVTERPFRAAVAAGLIAGSIATLLGVWFYGFDLPPLDWPAINGGAFDYKGSLITKLLVGGVFHVLNSAIFGLVFAIFLFPYIGKLVNPAINILKAVGFSMVLATIAAAFLYPYIYYRGYHAGFGGVHMGGWKLVFAIYLWHLIWGLVLGVFYNPLKLNDSRLSGT